MQLARWLEADTGLEMRPTALTAAQLRDAERALLLFEDLKLTFQDGARWLRTHYRTPATIKIDDAIKEFLAHLAIKGSSDIRRRNVRFTLQAFARQIDRSTIGNVTRLEVEKFLACRAAGKSARTWNHTLGDVTQFFNWLVDRGIVAENPTRGITKKVVEGCRPKILTIPQARDLMLDLETNYPQWCAFAALLLFGGVRPDGEILRLDAEIRASDGQRPSPIRTDGVEVDGKSHGRRLIPFKHCGPLSAWLAAYPPTPQSGLCPNPRARQKQADEWRRVIRPRHHLGRDELRHTAATAMISNGLNLGAVALTMGNSEAMLRRHYLDPLHAVASDYAMGLYAIMPRKT